VPKETKKSINQQDGVSTRIPQKYDQEVYPSATLYFQRRPLKRFNRDLKVCQSTCIHHKKATKVWRRRPKSLINIERRMEKLVNNIESIKKYINRSVKWYTIRKPQKHMQGDQEVLSINNVDTLHEDQKRISKETKKSIDQQQWYSTLLFTGSILLYSLLIS